MNRLIIVVGALSLFTLLPSCKKLGCKDVNAISFDDSVKKDDGSCVYESKIVVWLSQSGSTSLQSSGTSELKFYVNNELIGATSTAIYSTVVPECGLLGSAYVMDYPLGKVSSKNISLIIKDQQDDFLTTKKMTLIGNQCNVFQYQ